MKKQHVLVTVSIILLALLIETSAFPQKIDRPERKQHFDNGWKFHQGDPAGAASGNFDDKDWRNIDLPHDWSIEGSPDPKNPTEGSGGYFSAGIGWYRKKFRSPKEWKDKHISVYFEGVYMNAEIFINGRSLGVRHYGYSSFNYDLSPYLIPDSENLIAVRVDNSQQLNSRWYSGSGIYRHVWLIVAGQVHVADYGIEISTPEVSAQNATVRIKTLVKNETASPRRILMKTTIYAPDSTKISSSRIDLELSPHSEKEIDRSPQIPTPSLWSPENPHLYFARVEILQNNKTADEVTTRFGIRSLKFSSLNGFQLNGKAIKVNGGCVHHDNGCLGAAAFDRAEQRKITLLRSAGFNTVRTSHNPPSEAFLDACDSLGMLVIDESFDCWKKGKNKFDYARYFDTCWKTDLETMVRRDMNHPSIIMWSIGNEIVERGEPQAISTAMMLAGALKKIDSSRPITSAIVGTDKDWSTLDPLMAAHDIAGYNYHLNSAPADHLRVPSRVVLQTESYPKDAFANWNLVENNAFVIGDCVWTAMDYLGESGIGRWYYSGEVPGEHWQNDLFPWHGAYCGDIDLIGDRKPISHYRNLLYNNTEKLYMAVREPEPAPLRIRETWWSVWPTWASWTWPGQETKNLQVEVYSRYSTVRLYLNDSLIGEKPSTIKEEYKASFSLPYAPGVLKATGVDNGTEFESTTLQTAGDPANIRLIADKQSMTADGQDLIFVTVEITDKKGLQQPNATNRLSFNIEGPGIIMGVGNADMKDSDPYIGTSRKAWHGKALVVIRSTQQPGEIKLSATAPTLRQTSIKLTSSPSSR